MVANRTKKIMKDRKLMQGAIADAAGYNYKTFNNMLNGRKVITDTDVLKIAKALDVTPNDLFGITNGDKAG